MSLPRPQSVEAAHLLPALSMLIDAIEHGEPWREIGATGQPAFQNSWANVGGFNTAAFYKDALGIVHLKGMITSPAGAGTGNGTAAFTLPEGYRPVASAISAILPSRADTAGTGRVGYLSIGLAGNSFPNVDGVAANTVVTSFALDGISFRAA